jgi:hypothetical protein
MTWHLVGLSSFCAGLGPSPAEATEALPYHRCLALRRIEKELRDGHGG